MITNDADNNECDIMADSLSQSLPTGRLLGLNQHDWILQSDMGDYWIASIGHLSA